MTTPGRLARAYAVIGTTAPSRWLSRHVFWRLDPVLLRLTRGRLASTLVFPTGVLETTGARTGQPRRNAVIWFEDGGDVVVLATHAGAPRHPAWYHNLRAHPEVTFDGTPMVATVVADGAEHERLFALGNEVFPGFERYRRRAAAAGRTIPVVRLSRRAPGTRAASAADGSDGSTTGAAGS